MSGPIVQPDRADRTLQGKLRFVSRALPQTNDLLSPGQAEEPGNPGLRCHLNRSSRQRTRRPNLHATGGLIDLPPPFRDIGTVKSERTTSSSAVMD